VTLQSPSTLGSWFRELRTGTLSQQSLWEGLLHIATIVAPHQTLEPLGHEVIAALLHIQQGGVVSAPSLVPKLLLEEEQVLNAARKAIDPETPISATPLHRRLIETQTSLATKIDELRDLQKHVAALEVKLAETEGDKTLLETAVQESCESILKEMRRLDKENRDLVEERDRIHAALKTVKDRLHEISQQEEASLAIIEMLRGRNEDLRNELALLKAKGGVVRKT